MSAWIQLAAFSALLAGAAYAQPSGSPDRAPELMQLQLNSRTARPPPDPMDGTKASAIYKRFGDPAAHGGQAAGASPAATGVAQQ